jgi:hypothetical protein
MTNVYLDIDGVLQANSGKDATTAALSYTYKNPAITNFSFLPDHTVVYQMELQMAKNQQYVKAEY